MRKVPEFVIVSLVLAITWWVAATETYAWLCPPVLRDFRALAFDKQLQCGLLLTGIGVPGIICFLVPRRQHTVWFRSFFLFVLIVVVLLEAHYFSPSLMVLSFGFLSLYAWRSRDAVQPAGMWFRAVVGLLSAGILYLSFKRNFIPRIELYEDGPRLASANAFLLGQLPFRDFVVHYGVLQEVVRPILAFRLWGLTYEAYQRSGAWIMALSVSILFMIVAQTLRRKWLAIFVGAILLWRTDLAMPDRALFSALAVLFFCRGIAVQSRLWIVAAGFSSVASLLYSFEIGATLLSGFTGYFIARSISAKRLEAAASFSSWTIGILLGMGLLFLYLVRTGGTIPFLMDTRDLLLYRSATWADGLRSHLFSFRWFKNWQLFHTFLYIQHVPVLSIVIAAYLLLKAKAGAVTIRWHATLLLASILFFQFFIYVGRSDFDHWTKSTFFLVPLLALILDELLDWIEQPACYGLPNKLSAIFLADLIGLPFLLVIWGRQPFLSFLYDGFRFPTQGCRSACRSSVISPAPERLGTIPASGQEIQEVSELTHWIQSEVPSDGYFFDFSNQGALYFLSGRRNPTRFGLIDTALGDRMRSQCLRALGVHPPQAILAREENGTLICRKDLIPIRDYIIEHYRPRRRSGPWVLLVPKGGIAAPG